MSKPERFKISYLRKIRLKDNFCDIILFLLMCGVNNIEKIPDALKKGSINNYTGLLRRNKLDSTRSGGHVVLNYVCC